MIANITYGTFLFFGFSLVVGVTFVYFFLPETKGLSLEEMDIMFAVDGMARAKRRETDHVLSERCDQLQASDVGGDKDSGSKVQIERL
jgi:hypothetical protein